MRTFLLYFHVVIILIYAPYLCMGTRRIPKPSRDEFSDHWTRCEAILKQRATRSCTQSGGPSCTARRTSEPNEDEPGYWCNADSCPTVLSSLNATVYEKDLLLTSPGLWWYGVNISWAINATGTFQDSTQKTFLVAANIDGFGQTYYAEIDVTLKESDYINGVATLYYDCIYPISDNQSYTLHIDVKSKPHAVGDFQYTTVKTIPSVLTTSVSHPAETTHTSVRDQGHGAKYEPGDGATSETPPENRLEPDFEVVVNPGWLYGLLCGFPGVAVMCAAMFALYKHWTYRQNYQRLQKVTILAWNDDALLMKLNEDFLVRLRRSFKCRIVKLHDISLESAGHRHDILKTEMTSAACIIVVISQRLLDVFARLETSRHDYQGSRDSSSVALAIIYRELRLSPIHMHKIVSVQFEGRHIDPRTPCLSPWRCVSLPAGTDALVRFLKGDRGALEEDQMDTMGDTNDLNLDSGVQFSAGQSSISSATQMEVSSLGVSLLTVCLSHTDSG